MDITPLDADARSEVVVDVAVPSRLAALPVTPAMVRVEGGRVLAAGVVDPRSTTVAIVVDDGAGISLDDVTAAQAAAVELVRSLPDGTTVAMATPGGRRVPATADDGTVIREIGAITGAGPSVPLEEVVRAEARMLAQAAPPDRHLVVITTAAGVSEGIEVDGGIRLFVAAPSVAAVDDVARSIRDRVRVTLSLDAPGTHELVMTIGGETVTGTFEAGPVATPSTVPTTTAPAPTTTLPPTTTSAAPTTTPTTVATPTTVEARPAVVVTAAPVERPAATAPSADRSGVTWALVAAIAGLAVTVAVIVAAVARRTRRRRDRGRPAAAAVLALPPGPPPSPTPVAAEVAPADEPVDETDPAHALVPWDHHGRPAGARNGCATIDVNVAGAEELATLPGIGRATAQAIIDERQRHGSFGCVDDLCRVRGVGPGKVAGLRRRVTV